jgi:hypothetical protein
VLNGHAHEQLPSPALGERSVSLTKESVSDESETPDSTDSNSPGTGA